MTFVSVEFYLFLFGAVVLYYIVPIRIRWLILLTENMAFYYFAVEHGIKMFLAIVLISYACGRILEKATKWTKYRKLFLWGTVLLTGAPLLSIKEGNFILQHFFRRNGWDFLAPLGLSFFTVQMLSYLVDIYNGKIHAEKNPLKYILYISFFPQIIQGPIPRYQQLMPQLEAGHRFDAENITHGFQLILWGFFLKLMIADKAAVVVNTVFSNSDYYKGMYAIVAGGLYSLQLYTDFQACTKLAQGAARLFGVELVNNFNHPYFSKSIKEFWGRWHISLSECLKDYVYIPLGGNRKGKLRKYANLLITFLISGVWHGSGCRFLVWGGLHAMYQILGECTKTIREKCYTLVGIKAGSTVQNMLKMAGTYCLTTIAWIIFRAENLKKGLAMIVGIFTVYNPWVLFDDSLLSLGLNWKEWGVLLASVLGLIKISTLQEAGVSIREKIMRQPTIVRWSIYLVAVVVIMIFGTYGFGFNAQDFIYGGF